MEVERAMNYRFLHPFTEELNIFPLFSTKILYVTETVFSERFVLKI
jgi:hypothetical protein